MIDPTRAVKTAVMSPLFLENIEVTTYIIRPETIRPATKLETEARYGIDTSISSCFL